MATVVQVWGRYSTTTTPQETGSESVIMITYNGRELKMYSQAMYKIFWRPEGEFEWTPSNAPCLRAWSRCFSNMYIVGELFVGITVVR